MYERAASGGDSKVNMRGGPTGVAAGRGKVRYQGVSTYDCNARDSTTFVEVVSGWYNKESNLVRIQVWQVE